MAKRSGVRVTGQKEVARNLKAATERWKKAVAAGLYLEGLNIMGLSKRRVPVDWGTLRDSGYVTLPQELPGKTVVEMGYGGPAKDYAAVIHERLDLRHSEGGEAKYLERPVDERSSQILSNVSKLAMAAFAHDKGPQRGPLPTTPDQGGK